MKMESFNKILVWKLLKIGIKEAILKDLKKWTEQKLQLGEGGIWIKYFKNEIFKFRIYFYTYFFW